MPRRDSNPQSHQANGCKTHALDRSVTGIGWCTYINIMRSVLTKLVCNMYFEQQGCRTQVQMTKWLRCKGMHPSKTAMRNKTITNAWPKFCIGKHGYQWTPWSISYKKTNSGTSFFFKDTSQLRTLNEIGRYLWLELKRGTGRRKSRHLSQSNVGQNWKKARTPLIQEAKLSGRDSKVLAPEYLSLPQRLHIWLYLVFPFSLNRFLAIGRRPVGFPVVFTLKLKSNV